MTIGTNVASTANELNYLEIQLKKEYSVDSFFWMGRAATALLYAYSAIKKLKPEIENPEIILPSLSCATPSNTAVMCGLNPRYADISETTALATFDEIKKRYTTKTVAVLFIHLYGNTTDLSDLKKWCVSKNIFLIEDVAQSLGGILPDGNLSGSVGDFTVYSFNKTKILECGGGALAVKNKMLAEAVEEVIKKEDFIENKDKHYLAQLSSSYRNLHHSLVALKRACPDANISDGFLKLRKNYEPLFFRKSFDAKTLANDFKNLDKKLTARRVKAEIYKKNLSNQKLFSIFEGWEQSGCCWRFSFMVNNPEKLIDFSDAVRKDGFHLSNLYWPVNQFFNPNDVCPAADRVARRIINLWVDDSVTDDWVNKCCASVKKNSNLLS